MMRALQTASLGQTLILSAAEAGATVAIVVATASAWESATFSGEHHRITLSGKADPPLDRWLTALPEIDLPLRGHVVADITVADRREADDAATVTIAALTVVAT